MAITQTLTNSFKRDLLLGKHDFDSSGGHTFKIALFTSSASLDATTTDYSTTNEVTGTGYTAGGVTLTNVGVVLSGNVAYVDFSDASWPASTITARGAIIYNTTTDGGGGTTDAVAIVDFGTDRSSSASTFTVQFPTADAENAIIRLG